MLAMIVGLGLTHRLRNAVRLIQHPGRERPFWIQLVWTLSTFLLFTLCALLCPDDVKDYDGYEGYFMARRGCFFGVLAATYVVDIGDTLIKGGEYYSHLGIEYPIRARCS